MSDPTVKPDRPPVPPATPFFSFSPVVIQVPGRSVDLELRVSAPATGSDLPLILFSHGFGASNFLASMRGYGPLVDFYAAHGFVVIQPTHQSSKTLGLDPNGPEGPLFWKSRAEDMHIILDHLSDIEAAVPLLGGRLDHDRIAAVGHSMGAHTVCMLSGMRVTDPTNGEVVDLTEPRVRRAVMFGGPGNGADVAPWAAEHYPVVKSTDFTSMRTPGLVVFGDKDFNPLFSERKDYRRDSYPLSPGPKCLLTVFGGEHLLGGISGYDAAETTDEDPDRVAQVLRLSWAYLRSGLYADDPAWQMASDELMRDPHPFGKIECK